MSSPDSSPDHASQPPSRISAAWVWLPFFVSLVALAGSLWLTLGMGFKACPLCIYQRTFAMGVVAVFGVGVCVGVGHRAVLNLLALPLATAGFGVAALQTIAELIGRIECPSGILGIGTAPQESVVALGLLLVLVGLGAARSRSAGDRRWPLLGWAIVLGLLLAVGAAVSAPPLPSPPTKAYDQPPDACRAPYRPQSQDDADEHSQSIPSGSPPGP